MNQRFRVGITPDFAVRGKGLLEPALAQVLAGVEWEFMEDTGEAAKAEVIDAYDAVLVFELAFPKESLQGVRRLGILARWGVGYERIDVEACTQHDVMVAITPDAVRRSVAEGIFTFIFALAKDLRTLDRICRAGNWRNGMRRTSRNVEDATLGSVGAGNIAREMFRMARGVGFSRLLAYDPMVANAPEGVLLTDLETVLRESDFVAVNCPLTKETQHLIGERELRMMKPTAYLVNTARGPIVDYDALLQALRHRWIAGAGLDVFETEPIPAGHPVLEMDNILATPHAIAWTQELCRDVSLHACRNVLAVSQGNAPAHLANPDVLLRAGCQAKLSRWKIAVPCASDCE